MNRIITLVVLGCLLLAGLGYGAFKWLDRSHAPKLPQPSLKSLAASDGISIGNYAALKLLDDPIYRNILSSQFAFVSVDGELNWTFNNGSMRPSETSYNYSNPDRVFAFAEAKHLPVQAHHLVWGEEKWLPQWLKNGNYTPAQLLELIHQHINNVAGHYKGSVKEWSVVNEAFTRGQHINDLNDWWADHTKGQDYIDKSFIWARQADPRAKLLLNDFGNETKNSTSDAMYKHIQHMKATGVPVDGIGMQMHIDANRPPAKADVISNMKRFGELGVEVYVTEIDVMLTNLSGSQSHKWQVQGQVYKSMAEACIESGVCHSFALLGVTDKDSWWNELNFKNAEPLPFTDKYQPKPAFFELRQAFIEH